MRGKEVVAMILVVAVLVASVGLYTQNWPPAVIVESSSMMHRSSETYYGRIGTLDPGDLVAVKAVDSVSDIRTLVEGGATRYGKPGDVIVYYSANDRGSVPIIHRAVAYVEIISEGYRVKWDPTKPCVGGATRAAGACVYGKDGVTIPSLGIDRFVPREDGFFTKGDNPETNPQSDQTNRIARDVNGKPSIVPLRWVEGKARGEVPWAGLIKLVIQSQPNEGNPPASYVRIGNAYAPGDLWVMLFVSVAGIVGTPFVWDFVKARREKRAAPKP